MYFEWDIVFGNWLDFFFLLGPSSPAYFYAFSSKKKSKPHWVISSVEILHGLVCANSCVGKLRWWLVCLLKKKITGVRINGWLTSTNSTGWLQSMYWLPNYGNFTICSAQYMLSSLGVIISVSFFFFFKSLHSRTMAVITKTICRTTIAYRACVTGTAIQMRRTCRKITAKAKLFTLINLSEEARHV